MEIEAEDSPAMRRFLLSIDAVMIEAAPLALIEFLFPFTPPHLHNLLNLLQRFICILKNSTLTAMSTRTAI
jgi:hypothetical protein